MLTKEEQDFVVYWTSHRIPESSFSSKLVRGLPMALLFCLPILLLIVCIYFFLPDWYMKISATSAGTFITVVIAVLLAVVFYAFVRMHFKWEMNEQLYNELNYKNKQDNAANESPKHSSTI